MNLDAAVRTIRNWNISQGTLRTTADERRLAVAQDTVLAVPLAEREAAEARVKREDAHLFDPPISAADEEYINTHNR